MASRLLTEKSINKLRLLQFRELYRSLKTPWVPINFLIYGFLFWLEDIYLDRKIESEVDKAIKEYQDSIDQMQDLNSAVEYEEAHSNVPGLPTLSVRHRGFEKED